MEVNNNSESTLLDAHFWRTTPQTEWKPRLELIAHHVREKIQEHKKNIELDDNSIKQLKQQLQNLPPKSDDQVDYLYILCFLGIPGIGKTTQIQAISKMYSAPVFHLGTSFVRSQLGNNVDTSNITRRRTGELIQGFDTVFLDHCFQFFIDNTPKNSLTSIGRYIILDGFPRSLEQVARLIECMQIKQQVLSSTTRTVRFKLLVFNLQSSSTNSVELSLARQLSRALDEEKNDTEKRTFIDVPRFIGKVVRAFTEDKIAIDALKSIQDGRTVRVFDLDGELAPQDITQTMLHQLETPKSTLANNDNNNNASGQPVDNFDVHQLNFDRPNLRKLALASKECGVPAYIFGGGLARPFWNGKFGPPQLSTDVDVYTLSRQDAEVLEKTLFRLFPETRWSTHGKYLDPYWSILKNTSLQLSEYMEELKYSMTSMPMRFRCGGVRLILDSSNNNNTESEQLEVVMGEGAEYDLRNGILRFTVEPKKETEKEDDISAREAIWRVRKLLNEYPALTPEGKLKEIWERYKDKFTEIRPSEDKWDIPMTWHDIEHAMLIKEKGGKIVWTENQEAILSPRQKDLIDQIINYYRTEPRLATPPPRPIPSPLPSVLEELRVIAELREEGRPLSDKQRLLMSVPADLTIQQAADVFYDHYMTFNSYTCWFHFVAYESSDSGYKEWFLNQTRSRHPKGGRDKYLQSILDYSLFSKYNKYHGLQKPTHMGWKLHMHIKETMFQLDTDSVIERLKGHEDSLPASLEEIRVSLRLAALFHDCGKLMDINTPGAHGSISSKLWRQFHPTWTTSQVIFLTEWLIKHHDIYGRLLRGLTEKQEPISSTEFNALSHPTFHGAIDIPEVQRLLKKSGFSLPDAALLLKSLWTADVGSISALRWLLGVAPLVEELVSCSES